MSVLHNTKNCSNADGDDGDEDEEMKMPITEPTAAGMSKEADYMYTLAIADTKFINNSIAIILHCSINDTLM